MRPPAERMATGGAHATVTPDLHQPTFSACRSVIECDAAFTPVSRRDHVCMRPLHVYFRSVCAPFTGLSVPNNANVDLRARQLRENPYLVDRVVRVSSTTARGILPVWVFESTRRADRALGLLTVPERRRNSRRGTTCASKWITATSGAHDFDDAVDTALIAHEGLLGSVRPPPRGGSLGWCWYDSPAARLVFLQPRLDL